MVLGKAHATVAADRMRPKMLATARRRVDDVPGDVDVRLLKPPPSLPGAAKNRFEKAAVILAAATRTAGLARKQRRNPLPLRIALIERASEGQVAE